MCAFKSAKGRVNPWLRAAPRSLARPRGRMVLCLSHATVKATRPANQCKFTSTISDQFAPVKQQQFLDVIDRDEAERRFHAVLDLRPLEAEDIPLAEALHRVLAADIISP